jgi:hypothetical protein
VSSVCLFIFELVAFFLLTYNQQPKKGLINRGIREKIDFLSLLKNTASKFGPHARSDQGTCPEVGLCV